MKYNIHPDFQKLNSPLILNKALLPVFQAGTKILFQTQKT